MNICQGLEAFQPPDYAVLTTGTFDGVHLGHRKILDRLTAEARKANGESVLLTFEPHPRMVLHPDDHGLKLLNTYEEKTALLKASGIDHLVIYPFSKDFSRISSLEFIRQILVKGIGAKKLVIGYNHHFGRNREGTLSHLRECASTYGFTVEEIPAHEIDQVNISSSKIRKALEEGDVVTANRYLGYDYMISGTVFKGSSKGREIGFPTANIKVTDPNKLIPADGVYAVNVILEENSLKGMLNIGYRPTLHSSGQHTIEVHIFDFDASVYDKKITVKLKERIRDERKFDSAEALKAQLQIDRNKAHSILM